MASKRDHTDLDEGEISDPTPKRARGNHNSRSRQNHQQSSIDPTSGQRYVFSSYASRTTIPEGEESDFEDDAEAMAYLRSVSFLQT